MKSLFILFAACPFFALACISPQGQRFGSEAVADEMARISGHRAQRDAVTRDEMRFMEALDSAEFDSISVRMEYRPVSLNDKVEQQIRLLVLAIAKPKAAMNRAIFKERVMKAAEAIGKSVISVDVVDNGPWAVIGWLADQRIAAVP